jgi:hypothetical protein
MSKEVSFRRPLADGENPDNLPKHLALAGTDPYTGKKTVDLSRLAYMKMILQSAIKSGKMATFERKLQGLNFGRRPDDETVREILELEIPGQNTILQDIYELPENEFKHELMDYLKVEEPSFKGGKKRRSRSRKSRSKKISSRKSRKSRKTRLRRYRK